MEFSLDKKKALELAKKLGINVSFDNDQTGVFFKDELGDREVHCEFEKFFPELGELKQPEVTESEFVTRDKWSLRSHEITITQQVAKVKIDSSNQLISSTHTSLLNGAA